MTDRNEGTLIRVCRRLTPLLLLLLLVGVVAIPAQVSAEGFFDVFGGVAITDKAEVDVTVQGFGTESGKIDIQNSFALGGRAGWWFGFFGVGLDVIWFQPDAKEDTDATSTFTNDLSVVGIGLNAMLRLPLWKDENVPEGRFQPYVFGGPTLFVTTLDSRLVDSSLGFALSDSDTDTRLGFTAGGGLTLMFTKNIGVFAEYRFTQQKPEFELEAAGVAIKATLNTHHLLGGLAFRF